MANVHDVTNPTTEALSFAITAGDPAGQFSIDSSGNVVVAGALDYESVPSFNLLVETRTSHGYDTAMLTVLIGNVTASVVVPQSVLTQGDITVASLAVATDRGSLAGFTARIEVGGNDVVKLRHLDGTPLFPPGQSWIEFPLENLPNQILVEGTDYGTADLKLLALGPNTNTRPFNPDDDGVKTLEVAGLIDINVDTNNDGAITAADDPPSKPLYEVSASGKEVVVGQLVELKITDNTKAAQAGFKLTFEIESGHIKIWEDQNKTTIVSDATTTKEYTIGANVPAKLYVEGVTTGADYITAKLTQPSSGAVGATDEVKLTTVTENVVATLFAYDIEPTKSTMEPWGNQFQWTMIFNEAARDLFAYQLVDTQIVAKDAAGNVVHTISNKIIDLLPLDLPGASPFLQDVQAADYEAWFKLWVESGEVKSITFTRTGVLKLTDYVLVELPNNAGNVAYDPAVHGIGMVFSETKVDGVVVKREAETSTTRGGQTVTTNPKIEDVVGISEGATTYRVSWVESITTSVKLVNNKYYYEYAGTLTWDFREKNTLNANVANGIDRNHSAKTKLVK